MDFLGLYKLLLPNARAWRIVVEKTLRSFFQGLTDLPADAREFIDLVYLDLFPQSTRELDAWEQQFALPATPITEQERRDRLAGAWQAQGGQDPRYIQDTLRAAGFDVYVHESWEPASSWPNGPAVYRVSGFYLSGGVMADGEPGAQDGGAQAQDGGAFSGIGYALVNNDEAPSIPSDPNTWPFFLYIGGAVFPALASIPTARRFEFEALALKICPTHLWLGILVTYT